MRNWSLLVIKWKISGVIYGIFLRKYVMKWLEWNKKGKRELNIQNKQYNKSNPLITNTFRQKPVLIVISRNVMLWSTYVIQETHCKSCNWFISNTGYIIQVRQMLAYTLMKHLNQEGRGTMRLNFIAKNKWTEHYKKLWYNPKIPCTLKNTF